jgi:ABC-type sugar transport system ATPase subunit
MPLLSIQDVCIAYEKSRPSFFSRQRPNSESNTGADGAVLDRLSLDVAEGELLVLLGASGSGKSTLLKTIAGLLKPQSGRLIFDGADMISRPAHRRDLSLVLQNGGWYDHLTVEGNLRLEKALASERESVLAKLDLSELRSRLPSQLSGGQSQRLAIGRALLRNRRLLMLDEPLSQLDSLARESLRNLIASLKGSHRAIIYATHDQHDAMMLGDRIAVIEEGRIKQIDTPEMIYKHPQSFGVSIMLGQPPISYFTINGESIGVRPESWKVAKATETIDSKEELRLQATLVERRCLGSQYLETWRREDAAHREILLRRLIAEGHDMISIGCVATLAVPWKQTLRFKSDCR